MIVFVFTGQAPLILILALLDPRLPHGRASSGSEKDLPFLVKAWWVLLVLLFHVFGYAVFRFWLALRRRSSENGSKA